MSILEIKVCIAVAAGCYIITEACRQAGTQAGKHRHKKQTNTHQANTHTQIVDTYPFIQIRQIHACAPKHVLNKGVLSRGSGYAVSCENSCIEFFRSTAMHCIAKGTAVNMHFPRALQHSLIVKRL